MDDASERGELVQTVGPLLGPMAQMPIGPAESTATERSITRSAPDCEGMLGSDPELPVAEPFSRFEFAQKRAVAAFALLGAAGHHRTIADVHDSTTALT